MRKDKRKNLLIITACLCIFLTVTKAQAILAVSLFLRDVNYYNFVAMYAALMWPILEPYAAAFSVGPAQQQWLANKEMFEEVNYGYDQVYAFLMDVSYLTFWNSIDVFKGAQRPLIIDT